jgi:hypothetical protein
MLEENISNTIHTLYGNFKSGACCGAALMGQLKGFLDWEYVILSYIIFAGVMSVLIRFINFEKHECRVDELESKFWEP